MENIKETIEKALKLYKEDTLDFEDVAFSILTKIIYESGDEALKEKALSDDEYMVFLAQFGTDGEKWRIIENGSNEAREYVAKTGTKEMCIKLLNDADEWIREVAKNRLLQIFLTEEEKNGNITNIEN